MDAQRPASAARRAQRVQESRARLREERESLAAMLVPLVLVGRRARGLSLADGVLADVAPTLLELAGLPRWAGMTGQSRILW